LNRCILRSRQRSGSACGRDFSPTLDTLFAFDKLEIRDYPAAVATPFQRIIA
jgi:hypothetical protein